MKKLIVFVIAIMFLLAPLANAGSDSDQWDLLLTLVTASLTEVGLMGRMVQIVLKIRTLGMGPWDLLLTLVIAFRMEVVLTCLVAQFGKI